MKEYIRDGKFEDGDRMERWDVVLANRYLEALSDYLQRRPTYACWEVAFQYAERRKLIIMQHLLLGMNAHINWWI